MSRPRWSPESPVLYNLANELIWPDVIRRTRSHPSECLWRDVNGGIALHHVCRFQETVDVVREMLATVKTAAQVQDKAGSTPLHVACYHGSSEMILLLLKAHENGVTVRDNLGRTPLHLACASYMVDTDVIELLLKENPTVSMVRDDHGKTPLSLLCDRHESRMRRAVDRINQGENPDEVCSRMLAPIWKQLCLLLKTNVHNDVSDKENGLKLVHACTAFPDCPKVLFELALKLHPEQVKEKILGRLPLHFAAECPTSHLDEIHGDGFYICTLLALFPTASREFDRSGQLPLHIAAESGKTWFYSLRRLFEAFPDAIAQRDRRHRLLPFQLAALQERRDDPRMRHVNRMEHSGLTSLMEILRHDPSCVNSLQ